jgi:predicted lipid carrier protein YhbT
MADPTAEFFDELGRRGHEPLLADESGSIRVDVVSDGRADSWFISIRFGDIHVSEEEREADLVVRTERTVFNRIVAGNSNLYTAWLRREVTAAGDVYLGHVFEHLLPGPPRANHPRQFARERGQRA